MPGSERVSRFGCPCLGWAPYGSRKTSETKRGVLSPPAAVRKPAKVMLVANLQPKFTKATTFPSAQQKSVNPHRALLSQGWT